MNLEISEAALSETQSSIIYYNNCQKGLGNEFLTEVDAGLMSIELNPKLSICIKGQYRIYLIKRFPFGVIYKINKNIIYVVAIMHLRKGPNYWKFQ